MPNEIELKEYRCKCGKLLFKGCFRGVIEIKCPKCKHITQYILTENNEILEEVMTINILS